MNLLAELGGAGALSAAALLALVVLLILRGDLVPRKIHEQMIADRDQWRSTAEIERKRGDQRAAQVDQLIDGQRTIMTALEAVQREAER